MNYRRLGRSGLQVSELSIGSWVTYGNQVDHRAALLHVQRLLGIGLCLVEAHRYLWQTEQLVRCSLSAILYSRTSSGPSSDCALAGT